MTEKFSNSTAHVVLAFSAKVRWRSVVAPIHSAYPRNACGVIHDMILLVPCPLGAILLA